MKLSELVFKTSREAKAYLQTLGVSRWDGEMFCCPFHPDNNPSCYAYPTTVFCFSCQRAATYAQVTKKLKGSKFGDAVENLRTYMGISEMVEFDFIQEEKKYNEKPSKIKNSINIPFNRISVPLIDKEAFRFDITNPDTLKGNFIQFLSIHFNPGEYIAIRIDRDSSKKFGNSTMFITTLEKWVSVGYDRLLTFPDICGAYVIPNPIKPESFAIWKASYDNDPIVNYSVGEDDILEWRNLLVECDYLSTKKQLEAYVVSRLPIKSIVHSGANSLHALVRIIGNRNLDYGTEVYKRLQKWGVDLDTQCNSKYRWCRIPGFERHSIKSDSMNSSFTEIKGNQYLIPFNNTEQCKDIDEWLDIWDAANPPPEQILLNKVKSELESEMHSGKNLDEVIANVSNKLSKITNENMQWGISKSDVMIAKQDLPIRPSVIDGILRAGDIMLFGSGSKAKKSFNLMSLALAKAIGSKWLGKNVPRGRVLFCDFELSYEDFCWRYYKMKEERELIYKDIFPDPIIGFDFINFRNSNQPLDIFLNKLIELAKTGKYDLIILDPIYKLFNGEIGYDENSNSTVAQALIKLDKLASEVGCGIVITHHFKKNTKDIDHAMDKFAGAGVFARYPDVILALDGEEIDGEVYFTLSHTMRHFADPGDQVFTSYIDANGKKYISLVEAEKPKVNPNKDKFLPGAAKTKFRELIKGFVDGGNNPGRLLFLIESTEFDYYKYEGYREVQAWIDAEPKTVSNPLTTREILE